MSITQGLLTLNTGVVDVAERLFATNQIFGNYDAHWFEEQQARIQALADKNPESVEFALLVERMAALMEKVGELNRMTPDEQAKYWYLRNKMGSGWTHETVLSKMDDCSVSRQSKADWAQDFMESIYGAKTFEPLGYNIDWEGVYDDIQVDGDVDSFEFDGVYYIIDGLSGV